jgi:hypothetical protein
MSYIDKRLMTKINMDCFIQNLIRDKLLSVEVNNFNREKVVVIIEDGYIDRWPQPVSDDNIISGINSKKQLVPATTTTSPNADIGTDAASINHRPRCRLFVATVRDSARVFFNARPEVFRRMEGNKKQIDRWVANHVTHSSNNSVDIRREMNESRLVIPNRSWKQHHQRFRREKSESMLVIPKRSWKQLPAVIEKRRRR